MRILTAFNSRSLYGGPQEYTVRHVHALARQIEQYAPTARFQVLSDVKIPGLDCIPYTEGWPGWWIKISLCDPKIPGDFLFMDLDTVITGDLSDILAVDKLTLLRDFYRDGKKLKEGLGGGLMYFPDDDCRRPVWEMFVQQPQLNMRVYSRGDQFLFEKFWLNKADRWQDVVPGQICSWKVHCKGDIVPPDARVVCFHGQPRPFAVGQFLHLYRE